MAENHKCYQQGWTDVCTALGDTVPDSMVLDEPVDEAMPSFNRLAYLQGQMNALIEHVKKQDKLNRKAANVASCLANGITPD